MLNPILDARTVIRVAAAPSPCIEEKRGRPATATAIAIAAAIAITSRWALQQTAATSSITTPEHSSATDTTLVCSSVLKVNVTPVPAMPITSEITPNGNTQRYHDFSVPPVAWARRSSVGERVR
ncbi:hypothetical protein EYF80_048642 [Liparis tanakae]|uniref:Uncharacterized protein n=1 Tax=Liparis tanakae TaxID=230148 RepID=A0A4Z2FLM6_9TELE|nr:hypothetical protein EYF80_048642 [Liparis tanakae]